LAWKVEISAYAAKQISSLDKPTQKRIYTFLQKLESEDPFKLLIPYKAIMAGLWKKRLGDWRIVIEAGHATLTLIVMKMGIAVRFIGERIAAVLDINSMSNLQGSKVCAGLKSQISMQIELQV